MNPVPHVSEQWWLATLGRTLYWARLRVRRDVENDIMRGSARAEDPFAVRWPDAETGCGRTATRRQWEESDIHWVLEECANEEKGARAIACTGGPQRVCAGGTRVYWQRNPPTF